jgi:hypothetical protein
MENTKRRVWMSAAIASFTALVALGCASTAPKGTAKALGPGDLPSLAGKYNGTVTTPAGSTAQGTLEMSPTGEYVVHAGAFAAQGKAQIQDGNLLLTNTGTSGMGGAVTGPRTSIAAVSQRPDGSLVLTGTGHSATGPFNFEVVRGK